MLTTGAGVQIERELAADADGTRYSSIRARLIRDREARLAMPGSVAVSMTVRAYDSALALLSELRMQNHRRD